MAVIIRFQSTGSVPGSGDPVPLRGASLTIGRGAENDLALPDPDRTLSKRHCMIEDHNGNIVVVDISTNGTFLNYGKLPLGATPTPLNDGDILSVGPYELLVNITQEDSVEMLVDPLADIPVSHGQSMNAPSAAELLDAPGDGGDFLDDLLGGRDSPVGPSGVHRPEEEDDLLPPLGEDDPLLPPAADPYDGQGASAPMHSPSVNDHFSSPGMSSGGSAIPDDWDDDLLAPSSGPANASDPFAQPEPASSPPVAPPIPQEIKHEEAPAAPQSPPPSPAPVPQHNTLASGGGDEAAHAFLKSLGVQEGQVTSQDMVATMGKMGHVMRIMVEGMREILMTRTSIKSEFRIEQTMIQAGGNNPLKFSISPEQAIEAMVRPSAKGYLDASQAASEALDDIKAHEVAMVTGMESALRGILKRLDPAALEERISVGGGFSSVLKSKKARYWEIYESMYAEISDQAENDFHELFAREFARAYKEQLDKLK